MLGAMSELERVRPSRVAIVAGALVALQVAMVFVIRPVPDLVVSLLGGPEGGVARLGGFTIQYRPPGGGSVERIEMAGVAEDQASEITDVLVHGGITMREALETDAVTRLAETGALSSGVTVELDAWRDEQGQLHEVAYLSAPAREPLAQAVARARSRGWQPSPGAQMSYERSEQHDTGATFWRTYELAAAAVIDGTMIAAATGVSDPNTGRPMVLIELTAAGRERFCALTGELAGRKLATVFGDRVRSAPIINGAICGGRASIWMGGSDVAAQERERDTLVSALRQHAYPPGGTIEAMHWQPPTPIALQAWLGRLLLGLVAGALFGGVVVFAIRVARPVRVVRGAVTAGDGSGGTFPWRRLAVTLLGPIAVYGLGMIVLPGVSEAELAHALSRGGGSYDPTLWSVIGLGVGPLLGAFVLVEVVALAVPRLRWRRHDPRGRVALGQAVAILATVTALVQGWFSATYTESLTRVGIEVIAEPGWRARILIMASIAVGTLLLAVVAGMIREHGLGNGYGVVIVSGPLLGLLRLLTDHPFETLELGHALGLVTMIAIAAGTATVLRWRVGGVDVVGDRVGEPALRLPLSGMNPLRDAGVLMLVPAQLIALGRLDGWADGLLEVQERLANRGLMFGVLIVLVAVWGWIFARPAVVSRVALQAGGRPPSRDTWLRGALLSALLLVGVAALDQAAIATHALAQLVDPLTVMLGTAVVLDILADARAHRRALAPAAVLHQLQYAGVVEQVLAAAQIPCHLHASHLRALFAFFGPWCPVIVLVPAAQAEAARAALDDVLRTARGQVPRARVIDAQRGGDRSDSTAASAAS